jgi:hypothetical protein
MLVYLPSIALQHSASILTLSNGSESSCSGISVVAMRFPVPAQVPLLVFT